MSLRCAKVAIAAALAVVCTATAAQAAAPSAYVYASSWSMTVRQYSADDAGLLRPLVPAAADAGSNSTGAAASPDGRSLYVVNQTANSVSEYDVGADGALTAKAPAQVATGTSPFGVAIAPDGRHVYVANQGDGTVGVYAVDSAGALTLAYTASAGTGPVEVALSPDGHSAYVTNFSDETVSQYDVLDDGALAAKDPATVPAGAAPVGLALSPDGDNAYVADQAADGTVSQFAVGAGGTLTPLTPDQVAAGVQPAGIVAGPDGVYVANFGSSTISQYDADAEGALRPKDPAEVASADNPFGLALAPGGHSLYAAAFGAAAVGQYDVGADGDLAPKDPRFVSADFHPIAVAVASPPDDTAPTIDLRTPAEGATYELDADVRADFSCADDGGSGVSACAGDVADGDSLGTSGVGEHAFTVVARDGAGNETRVTHQYRVVYPFAGFFGPVGDGDHVQAGTAFRIAFSLGGDRGLDVLAEGSPSSALVDCDDPGEPTGGEAANSDRGLRFNALTGRYRFEWQTDSAWAGTCRSFILTLNDGTVHRLLVAFD